MDSFHKPSALSFDGNTSENWRRFKQKYDIYLTASGSEKKEDTVKIAILLNFAGEDAIEVFNTFDSTFCVMVAFISFFLREESPTNTYNHGC